MTLRWQTTFHTPKQKSWATRVAWVKYLCSARCDQLYVHKCVVRVGVLSTPPVGCREVYLPANRNWSCLRKISRMVRLWSMPGIPSSCRPIVSFPFCGRKRRRRRRQVSRLLVHRTSSLFEGLLHCRTPQFLRTLILFFVLLVSFKEWFYIPAGSLPYIFSCNLLHSLRCFNGCWGPSWFNFRIQCLSRRVNDFSKAILSNNMM